MEVDPIVQYIPPANATKKKIQTPIPRIEPMLACIGTDIMVLSGSDQNGNLANDIWLLTLDVPGAIPINSFTVTNRSPGTLSMRWLHDSWHCTYLVFVTSQGGFMVSQEVTVPRITLSCLDDTISYEIVVVPKNPIGEGLPSQPFFIPSLVALDNGTSDDMDVDSVEERGKKRKHVEPDEKQAKRQKVS